jgi:hypothetical protein
MNQIACAMLNNNLFIINDISNKKMNSARIQYLISMFIKFNELILPELCIKTYKGIIIFKTTNNRWCIQNHYIMIDAIIKTNAVKDTTTALSKLSLVDGHSTDGHGTDENSTDVHCTDQYSLMDLLETGINDLYQSNTIECYDSSYNGKKYDYNINNRVKIDLDVINGNFVNIKDTRPLDHIKLEIEL